MPANDPINAISLNSFENCVFAVVGVGTDSIMKELTRTTSVSIVDC